MAIVHPAVDANHRSYIEEEDVGGVACYERPTSLCGIAMLFGLIMTIVLVSLSGRNMSY